MNFNYVLHLGSVLLLLTTKLLVLVSGDIDCEKLEISRNRIVCKCNATYCDTINPVVKLPDGKYIIYTSSKDGLRFSKSEGYFNKSTEQTGLVHKVNRSMTHQKIMGFGGAITDSAGINILTLSEGAHDKLIRSYFSSEGIEYNFARVPIGGCDFSTRKYTLDDNPGDRELKKFSLSPEDLKYKIPVIKKALTMSKRKINLIGTAWTAPPWMKTNNDFTGYGFLKHEYYQLWAEYHLKFLEEYKKEGLYFWGLTTGNEPLNGFLPMIVKFNSMGWYPSSMSNWIAENLGPRIRSSEFNLTKIILFDDQRILLPNWVDKIMSNKKAAKYVDGFGIHWYWDFLISVTVVTELLNSYPDKFAMNTEASQGDKPWEEQVILGSWERGESYAQDIMEDINNGMTAWIEWNLALDMSGGPNWAKNFVDAPILVNRTSDEFFKQPMFYAIGHFSKFIKPSALRIEISPLHYKNLDVLAALNEDGCVVVVLHNWSSKSVVVTLVDSERGNAVIKLKPYSFNSVIYW